MKHMILAASAIALVGCASTSSPATARQGGSHGNGSDTKTTVRLYTGADCPITPIDPKELDQKSLIGTIAGFFLPALIDKGLSAFSTALNKAAADKPHIIKSTHPAYLYKAVRVEGLDYAVLNPDPNMTCILVVKGKFSSPTSLEEIESRVMLNPNKFDRPAIDDKKSEAEQKDIEKEWEDKRQKIYEDLTNSRAGLTQMQLQTRLNDWGIGLEAAPDLVYEGRLQYTSNYEAFRLVSTYLNVFSLTSTKSKSKPRPLGLSIAYDAPHAYGADSQTLQAITLDFGAVKIGTRKMSPNFGSGAQSALKARIAPDETAKGELDRINALFLQQVTKTAESQIAKASGESDKAKVLEGLAEEAGQSAQDALGKPYRPVNLTVSVVETEKGNGTAKFFAEIFDASKDSIATRLKSELDFNAKAQAAQTEAETQEDTLATTEIAYLEARLALKTLQDSEAQNPGTVTALQFEVAEAKLAAARLKYNRARLAQGLPAVAL